MKSDLKTRYNYDENKKLIIELNVGALINLFDNRDPAPYREKDLDDDAFEYIVACTQEISISRLGAIKILTTDKTDLKIAEPLISMAMKDFFSYQKELTDKKTSLILSGGFKALIIGLIFLSTAVFSSKILVHYFDQGFWGNFLKEGLLLMGWVSMWKPINVFLYEWWPIVELSKTYEAISKTKVILVHVDKPTGMFIVPPELESKF